MLVDVCRGPGLVIAKLAGIGLTVRVSVLDVAVEIGPIRARHFTVGALVVVDVRPHVVPQQSLQGKLLPTIIALVGVLIGDLLPLTVVQEFDPG